MHRINLEVGLVPGTLEVTGEEAHHAARVKRVEPGEAIEVLDGRGNVGRGRLVSIDKPRGEWRLVVEVQSVHRVEPERPRVEVWSAAPKGSRLSDMIDGLAQVGAASWRLLATERGVSESPKLERLQRIAVEASKQSGRAWHMEIGMSIGFEEALRDPRAVLADASGERYTPEGDAVILIGPEGGWSPRELAAARAANIHIRRFGIHTMRIETAAVIAAGIAMSS